jgi:hypothetical protein
MGGPLREILVEERIIKENLGVEIFLGEVLALVKILGMCLAMAVQRREECKIRGDFRIAIQTLYIHCAILFHTIWNKHAIIEPMMCSTISILRQASVIGSEDRRGCSR